MIHVWRIGLLVWRRELSAVLGLSGRAMSVAAVGVVSVLLATDVTLFVIFQSFFDVVTESGGESPLVSDRALAAMVLAGSGATATMCAVIVCASMSQSTALDHCLRLLPVSARVVTVGLNGPPWVLGVLAGLAATAPGIAVLHGVTGAGYAASAVVLIAITAGTALSVMIVFIAVRRSPWLRMLPGNYRTMIAAAVSMVAAVGVYATDFVPRRGGSTTGPWWVLLPHRALARALTPAGEGIVPDVVPLLALIGEAVAVLFVAGRVLGSDTGADNAEATPRVLGSFIPRGRQGARIAYHAHLLVRLPQAQAALSMVLLLDVLVAVATWASWPALVVAQAARLSILLPWGIAGLAYGAVHRQAWIDRGITAQPTAWVAALPLGAAVPCLFVSALGTAVVLTNHALAPSEVVETLTLGISLFAVAITAGLLAPFSLETPLSATVTAALTSLLWVSSSLVIHWGMTQVDESLPSMIPPLVVAAAALSAYAMLAVQRKQDGLV